MPHPRSAGAIAPGPSLHPGIPITPSKPCEEPKLAALTWVGRVWDEQNFGVSLEAGGLRSSPAPPSPRSVGWGRTQNPEWPLEKNFFLDPVGHVSRVP